MLENPLSFKKEERDLNLINSDVKSIYVMGLTAIIDGHVKEALGMNQNISETRMKICRECPLYKQTVMGAVCNNKLWLDPNTGRTSDKQRPGYKNGCGCRISAKTRLTYTHCPLGKW